MSPRDKRKDLRNILIIAAVAIIVIGVYLIATSPDTDSIETLSPDEVVENYEQYLGKTITVVGYYYHSVGQNNSGYITSVIEIIGQSSTDYKKRLDVDHSSITNFTPAEETKYRFTGILQTETLPSEAVVLVATEIRPV
jgi:hypothetical protein